MTRQQKLDAIWNAKHPDFRGITADGRRTILVNGGGLGTMLAYLDGLSDQEIEALLPRVRRDH